MAEQLTKAAILGGGVIGGGWLAWLIENGVEVVDREPDGQTRRIPGED
jgi:carnitine 3-dehydrogenase